MTANIRKSPSGIEVTVATPADIPTSQVGPYLDVTEYGAVGDGTDDTAAIDAAITAAEAQGRGVFFPEGVYSVSAPIVPPAGMTLLGLGAGRSVLELDAASGSLIAPSNTSSIDPVVLFGLGLRHAQSNADPIVQAPQAWLRLVRCLLDGVNSTGELLNVPDGTANLGPNFLAFDTAFDIRKTAAWAVLSEIQLITSAAYEQNVFLDHCTFRVQNLGADYTPGGNGAMVSGGGLSVTNCNFLMLNNGSYSGYSPQDLPNFNPVGVAANNTFRFAGTGTKYMFDLSNQSGEGVFFESGTKWLDSTPQLSLYKQMVNSGYFGNTQQISFNSRVGRTTFLTDNSANLDLRNYALNGDRTVLSRNVAGAQQISASQPAPGGATWTLTVRNDTASPITLTFGSSINGVAGGLSASDLAAGANRSYVFQAARDGSEWQQIAMGPDLPN